MTLHHEDPGATIHVVRAALRAGADESTLQAAFRALGSPDDCTVVRLEVARAIALTKGNEWERIKRAALVARPRPVPITFPMRRIYK